MLIVEPPKPSRYLKHSVVEEFATDLNKHYREQQSHAAGYPVDVESFADLDLEMTIVRERIDEPELTTVFAKCAPDLQRPDRCVITINTVYEQLFKNRPDLLRSTLGHEIGHYVLRHHKWIAPSEALSLFELGDNVRFLHDSSWKPFAFTRDDINEWCRRAFKGEEQARSMLAQLQDRMEPEWMFWQAEHFSMCLLIPRDRILGLLNSGCEVSSWFSISRLAEKFGVSPSMMRVRLTKIGAITIEKGKPAIGPLLKQRSLLRN